MPGPVGNFDDVIAQILAQQQGGEAMAPDGTPVEMAGAADTYSYGNGMAPRAGMPTDQYAPILEADRQQAILLKKALQQMRQGR